MEQECRTEIEIERERYEEEEANKCIHRYRTEHIIKLYTYLTLKKIKAAA